MKQTSEMLTRRRLATTFFSALRRGGYRIARYGDGVTIWTAPSGREYDYPLLRDLFLLLVADVRPWESKRRPADQGDMENRMQEPETTSVHESRTTSDAEAYKAAFNHLFRKAYRQLTDAEKAQMDAIKDQAWLLRCAILGTDAEKPPMSREQAIAMTNLEQAVMWAVKHVTG